MNQQPTDPAGPPTPSLWRAVEERLDAPAFREMMAREFPDDAHAWTDPVSRRRFLALAGASLGLAGLAGCYKAPRETIVPYVRQPEQLVLGKPNYYATAMPLAGSAIGLLVESHEGRPTKVEGNPDHPLSGGATDALAQASVLSLYDPDRSQSVLYRGLPRSWEDALREIRRKLTEKGPNDRTPILRILTGAIGSPTTVGQLEKILTMYPGAEWVEWEPALAFQEAQAAGCERVFGKPYAVHYDLGKADVILTLDADVLASGPEHIANARQFADRRRPPAAAGPGEAEAHDKAEAHAKVEWNRLYAVESTPTPTGMSADNRLTLAPHLVAAFARKLAEALEVGVPASPDLPETAGHKVTLKKWVEEVAKDLKRVGNKALVIAGEGQPAAVHALALAINARLGSIGTTVTLTEPLPRPANHKVGTAAFAELTRDMAEGKVDVLLIVGVNPVYAAPVDIPFAEALRKVRLSVHKSLFMDETGIACMWHLPLTHYLETWDDVVAADGTATVMQPLIAPLYQGRPFVELLSALVKEERTEYKPAYETAYELIRATWLKWWEANHGSVPGNFENFWIRTIHDGVVKGYRARSVDNPAVQSSWWTRKGLDLPTAPESADDLTLVFRLDPTLFDGQFSNNGWLQELPKPITKLTWGNAALLSPATAAKLGVSQTTGFHGGNFGELLTDVVRLTYRGKELLVPACIQPGQPDGVVTLHLGHGRERAGRVGNLYGVNASRLWTADATLFGTKLTVQKTNERFTLACTQILQTMGPPEMSSTVQVEERGILRFGTVEGYNAHGVDHIEAFKKEHEAEVREEKKQADLGAKEKKIPLTMFASQSEGGPIWDKDHQWAMAIDLSACTGCSACVVACQAENNISVVGKDQVTRGRSMHWLRIDRYFFGDENEVSGAYTQPVPCMHCENAPCELVCPVEATSHSPDGLNEMTYNRCVGTRYCSNNCPYKVRRFNFLAFADLTTPSLFGLRNPDVTVRTRGVMEKCTYCVQRIRGAGITAQNEGRAIRDGEIVTACEAACPSKAIVFGNKQDPNSRVSQLRTRPTHYGLLTELNTRPRTTYLAALKNPNLQLLPQQPEEAGKHGH